MTEEVNSSILLTNSEPVPLESSVEKSPASLGISQPSSSSVPSSSTVQEEPVLVSAAEVSASNLSLQTPSPSSDGFVNQPTSVLQNSASNVPLTTDNVRAPGPIVQKREPVIMTYHGDRRPSGPLLLDVKRQRARERQERMNLRNRQAANGSSLGLSANNTNGSITNAIDNATYHPATDDATYLGTRHKYSHRYDIVAPDEKEKCCVLM